MKVADVRRNLVPDTWTADGEGALPKLGPWLRVLVTTAALVVEERRWRRPDSEMSVSIKQNTKTVGWMTDPAVRGCVWRQRVEHCTILVINLLHLIHVFSHCLHVPQRLYIHTDRHTQLTVYLSTTIIWQWRMVGGLPQPRLVAWRVRLVIKRSWVRLPVGSLPLLVITSMGDCLRTGKPPRYITNRPC